MKAGEVLDFVAGRIDVRPEKFPDGGFFSGSPDDEVNGILVTWMATCAALEAGASRSLNLVVCHESPFFQEEPELPAYRWTTDPEERPYERGDHPNQKRRRIIEDAQLTILHMHYGLDRLCLGDDFAKAIGLEGVVAGSAYEKVFCLPQPVKLRELAEDIARRLKSVMVRVVGDPEKVVRRAGNCWGGTGLSSNRYFVRKQVENGAEVIVCGEADEEAMLFALEYNVSLILTGHAASENIGLKNFSSMLSKEFPGVPIDFYEVGVPLRDLCDSDSGSKAIVRSPVN